MDIDELSENFELLEDWEDKYRYLIDLGEKLPPFEEEFRTDEWKISGCQSQVWLVPFFTLERNALRLDFAGDSDAAIVRGLIAVVLTVFNGKTREEILSLDVAAVFARLGLADHLSPSRRNGLGAMVEKIRFYASEG
jgi:Fe-S metabolism associated sufE